MKLMQGIEAIEDQVKNGKEIQEGNVFGKAINVEVSEISSDKAEWDSDILPESQTEVSKEQEQAKKKRRNAKKTTQKQVFSFRAAVQDINVWKTFSTATGRTMESIGADAMNEYMNRHRMSDTEAAVFKALLAKYADRQTCRREENEW